VNPLRILANNPAMMILAFVVAMVTGGFPGGIGLTNSNIAMLSLIVMMSLSLTSLRLRGLKLRDHSIPIRNAFLLSFVISTGVTIVMSYLFQGDMRDGWIIMAAVPSAVVLPWRTTSTVSCGSVAPLRIAEELVIGAFSGNKTSQS